MPSRLNPATSLCVACFLAFSGGLAKAAPVLAQTPDIWEPATLSGFNLEPTGADRSAPIPMTFEEVERRLRAHPSLDALGFEVISSQEDAVAALGLPDPVVSVQINNYPIFDPSFTEFLPTNKSVGFRQQLPNRARRDAQSRIRLSDAAQSQAEIEARYARMRGRTIALLIARSAIEELRNYAQDRNAKYIELVDVINIEITAGRPLLYRLAQVEVEQSEVATTLAELEGQLDTIDAELTELVGLVPRTSLPPISLRQWSGGAADLYDVRVAQAAADKSAAGVDRARADFGIDWSLNVTYQQREAGRNSSFGGDDWVSGGVSLSIPLWSRQKQEPALRAARSRQNAALARVTSTSRQLRSEWQRLDARRETASRNIEILEQNILSITQQIESQLITYESGTGDYSPILDGEIAILTLQSQRVSEAVVRDQSIALMNSLLVTQ